MATGRINEYAQRYGRTGLLFVEPKADCDVVPVVDTATRKTLTMLQLADARGGYRGVHTCVCGAKSDNNDYVFGKFVTNSLAAHYLMHHRGEVPEDEIKDAQDLPCAEASREDVLRYARSFEKRR